MNPSALITKRQRERFYALIDKDSDGCWQWRLGKDSNGFGRFVVGSKQTGQKRTTAHRLAWMLDHPSVVLPPGECIRHTCGNPACCRPEHLYRAQKQEPMSKEKHVWSREAWFRTW